MPPPPQVAHGNSPPCTMVWFLKGGACLYTSNPKTKNLSYVKPGHRENQTPLTPGPRRGGTPSGKSQGLRCWGRALV